ncbi:hypothetical protein B0T24DRAFT_522674, partial [Lasiosphaeria ovina]
MTSETGYISYARHGDIKPENILWFGAENDGLGLLAYSDFGLTKMYSSRTKSRGATQTVGFTVAYRPPEIEIRGVIMSRSADMWSLGCVFLEMVCWILGGPEELSRFSSMRALDSMGVGEEGFFSVKPTPSGSFEFSIKAAVTRFADGLRSHLRCTQFIRDLLDLIQHKMLLITAVDRITSGALAGHLDRMHQRVMDIADSDYIRQGRSWPDERRHGIQPTSSTVLKSMINTDVQNLIQENRIRMTERFTLRISAPRRSIRVAERPVRAPTGPAVTVSPPTGQQPTSRLKGSLCSLDQESSAASRIEFQGTQTEISTLAQFLCWIAATFRLPRLEELTCSNVDFRQVHRPESDYPAFTIGLQDLLPLEDMPGTCWKPLFPSAVMAVGFPVPACPGTRGLRIPFDAMLEMAGILYDVALEDEDGNTAGIYFDGISYTLYPTTYIKDQNAIQWHLVSKGRLLESANDHSVAPDSGTRPRWERISNLETLANSTAILGYCGDVQIQLGTAARAQYHSNIMPSLSTVERPPVEIASGSGTVGFSLFGITVSTSGNWRTRNAQRVSRDSRELDDYVALLDSSEKRAVILYDTADGKEKAWMVPELSLILELFNIWAMRRRLGDIKYAEPGPDGGAEARKVLAGDPGSPDYSYSKRKAVERVLDTNKDKQIGNIIEQIWGSIQKIRIENAGSDTGSRGIFPLGQTGLTGWDWLELAD